MVTNVIILVITLLAVGAGLFFGVSWMMANVLLSPPRMVGGRAIWCLRRLSPKDLDLAFEEITFGVKDVQSERLGIGRAGRTGSIDIPAWWIPAAGASSRCVILVHGYSDSKVGGIAWAPTFRSLGYNVLAVDLRAHGEAGGAHSTAAYYERHDLSQVIDQLRAAKPSATRQLVLFGVSLGAAVAAATAELREGRDLAGVILDCPYSDYASAAMTHGNALGMPGTWFQKMGIRLAERISGADFMEVAPVRVIPRVPCALMVIHGADDLFITPGDMDRVEAAVKARPAELGITQYWRPDGVHHVLALRSNPAEFERRVRDFLDRCGAGTAQIKQAPDERSGGPYVQTEIVSD